MSTLPSLSSRKVPLADPRSQIEALEAVPLPIEFHSALEQAGSWPLRPGPLRTLQLNLGKMCNQTCRHCHVDAGPDRTEVMTRATMELCLVALERSGAQTVDLTGGAPEMNPSFRWLVEQLRARSRHVMVRTNLTILETGPHRDLVDFYARHRVEVVCSLPHFRALSTDRQRGDGVFERSIAALKRLNAAGYGSGASGLRLVLVTNPVGAFLPGDQKSLEAEWKRELKKNHGIVFDSLFAITNMPISRFLEWLQLSGNLEAYMAKLVAAFNPAAAVGLMCRDTLSVSWDGKLYDCDFNQMLALELDGPVGHVRDFDASALAKREVVVRRHCFGCTAGAGSSCGGATAR
jgi:radical SAM/Cys-rich protein